MISDNTPLPYVNAIAGTIRWTGSLQTDRPYNRVIIGKLRYDGTWHATQFARNSVTGPILVYERALSADSVAMVHEALRELGQSQGKPYGALPPAPQP